jgi:Ran GTPase-activating protein (RanGAP) involved in mRNA processing and transport
MSGRKSRSIRTRSQKKRVNSRRRYRATIFEGGEQPDDAELQSVQRISIGGQQIGDDGMRRFADAVAKGTSLPNLTWLGLSQTKIGDEGMEAFASAVTSKTSPLPNLQELYLDGNPIGDRGMEAFASASGSLSSLKKLSLQWNKIGDDGMKAFADAVKGGSLPNLTELELAGTRIGDEGMKAFASAIITSDSGSPPLPKLWELRLEANNKIGDVGMKAFADAIRSGSLPKVKRIWVDGYDLTKDYEVEMWRCELFENNCKHPQLQAACDARGIGLYINR